MSIFNSILSLFNISSDTSTSLGKYKKRSSYLIQGTLNNVHIDLNNIDYNKLDFKISHGRYHINALMIVRQNGKTYTAPEPNKAISCMAMTWNTKERTKIGSLPIMTFRKLSIHYCAMNKEALFAHIEQINIAWDLPLKSVQDWIKNEVEVYDKPAEFSVTRSEGKDKTTRILIKLDELSDEAKYLILIYMDIKSGY